MKSLKLLTNFYKIFLIFTITNLLNGCVKNNLDVAMNSNFEKKYGEEVAYILSKRAKKPEASDSDFPDFKSSLKNFESYTPDFQVYNQGRANVQNSQLPADIFDVNYNAIEHPPFVYSGLEFDTINIPSQDYYKIKSDLSDKKYLIAGNQALQKNIDGMLQERTAQDIEMSNILIKEQKKLRREQKMQRVFGSNIEKNEKDDENSITEVKLKNIDNEVMDESLKKAIALQVIQQNMLRNAPPVKKQ